MAKDDFTLPPDIIQAIEEVGKRGGKAIVSRPQGSWRVQEEKIRTVAIQKI